MTKTQFKHKFGGWLESDAIRHINPDGSQGGIVAVSASIGEGVRICEAAEVCPGASIGDRASIGDQASIGNEDWWISCGPQGSRNAMLTAVQSKDGLRWWVGCKHGVTTEALLEMVAKTHGGGPIADDYRHVIHFVETHPGRLRNIAERGADHG